MRRGLAPETAADLQKAFLELNEGPGRDLLRYLYSVDGYVVADDDTYRDVESLAREYGLLQR